MTNKTQATTNSVQDFLNNYPNQKVIKDCFDLIKIFEKVTNNKPVLWGKIIGFGSYHYVYESGREGDSLMVGFTPSKVGITIYTNCDLENNTNLLNNLGKHKISKSCLYIKKLEDINIEIFEQIIKDSYNHIKDKYKV
jgi:Domain of unknown function (DU1801)